MTLEIKTLEMSLNDIYLVDTVLSSLCCVPWQESKNIEDRIPICKVVLF